MRSRYAEIDFEPVPGVDDAFYCPACNRSPEDSDWPSCGPRGVCGRYGTGSGSLTRAGVQAYLAERERGRRMTGYMRRWACEECGAGCESMDWPDEAICTGCERQRQRREEALALLAGHSHDIRITPLEHKA